MGQEAEGPADARWGLDKKVKGFTYSDKLSVFDPVSGVNVKKDIKPFMVNQSVILLERDRLILNDSDNIMWKQMQDYQVVKISSEGRPTYTSVNEHTVDALNMAILAMTLEFPDITNILHKVNVTQHLTFAPSIPGPEMEFIGSFLKAEKDQSDPLDRPGDKQTWFRVDSLQKTRMAAGNMIVVPRGFSGTKTKKGPFTRPKL